MSFTSFALRAHEDRKQMGRAAAQSAARTIRDAVDQRGSARMIAASAPSQLDVYRALAEEPDMPWDRVTVFHMDEYLGLDIAAPQRFANWLIEHFVGRVNPQHFHPMRTESEDRGMGEYVDLLRAAPVDLVCLGIGVNGHIAFNEPPHADLDDAKPARIIELDHVSRVQQVDDECFATLEDVPTQALTLTIPTLMAAAHLVCAVPGPQKAAAVRALVEEPVGADWPCTVLRRHGRCEVHVDREAAALLGSTA
ncbi:Glucosamine-6-phosphate deaminase [Microbacterium esteraromaticum]|uniref:Glucosamine-6-phosphate deaminase n=1 Tax=Microbacterium esteraromaticum TaxID=57043 RepID=A0A1R4IP12_9MICO|nr:6-phosphogluconolactonase [Microbacterium esteraromaticum]SJN21596.1 Glucosamine-6-phosphate deaminase [Microbacterium esteraromaticum]